MYFCFEWSQNGSKLPLKSIFKCGVGDCVPAEQKRLKTPLFLIWVIWVLIYNIYIYNIYNIYNIVESKGDKYLTFGRHLLNFWATFT